MKKIFVDEFNTILHLNKKEIQNFKLDDHESLEDYFKDLFLKLKQNDISIGGYYQIKIYQDNDYGLIVELEKEDLDNYGYFEDQIDMRLVVMPNKKFMYLLNDQFLLNDEILNKLDIYLYKNQTIALMKESLNEIELGILLEHASILYKDDSNLILKNAKRCLKNNKK